MIKDRSFEDNAEYFATVFEIGRRHKILNPERMRTDYGKLIHLLMDSQSSEVQRLLEFQLVKRVSTVHEHLKQRNCLKLLEHPDAVIATTAITDHGMFLESNGGIPYKVFLSYLQDKTANSAHLAAIFCPVLVCPQNPLWELYFFHIFGNPSSS